MKFEQLMEKLNGVVLDESTELQFTRTNDKTVKWMSEIDNVKALDRIAANNYYLNRSGEVVKLEKDDTGIFDSIKGTTFTTGGWTHGKGQYKKTDLIYKIGKESDYKKFKSK